MVLISDGKVSEQMERKRSEGKNMQGRKTLSQNQYLSDVNGKEKYQPMSSSHIH